MTRYNCKNCNTIISKEEYEQNRCKKCGIKGARFFRMTVKEDNVK